jgi:hypothetical protein
MDGRKEVIEVKEGGEGGEGRKLKEGGGGKQ